MKKVFFTLGCLLFLAVVHAQTLYGTTSDGGTGINPKGTICRLVSGTNALTAAYTFNDVDPDGRSPRHTNLVQDSDGKMYGMTADGGANLCGIIFSFDPATSTYTKLKDLDSAGGANPGGSFLKASDGKLYGTTTYGGNGNYGTIFSFDPATGIYKKLKDLDSTNGAFPFCTLVQAKDGKLYGTTSAGGNGNFGVIFSFNLSNSTFTKLKDFDSTNGYYPFSGMTEASNGKLYGMTTYGGSKDKGVIYSFNPSTLVFSKLLNFIGTNGANPYGSLMQASDGKLYGMTSAGGVGNFGLIFSFNPSNAAYTRLKLFADTDGSDPLGTFIQAADGKLYAMTNTGGLSDEGVIFSFVPSNGTYTVLKEFDGTNGGNPHGELTMASNGKLYGLARSGGGANYGVIFSFVPSTAAYTRIKVFGAVVNGSNIVGGVVQSTTGKLYGMFSSGGGMNGLGGIYSFDPATSVYTKLFDFNGTNGGNPQGSLTLANDGKLYGMTVNGGSNNAGVIFSFDPVTLTYAKLKDFDSVIGALPQGSLVQASDGKLYGMTAFGGSSNFGVLFSFNPATSVYTRLLSFNSDNGANPRSTLIQATDGKLYGMTTYGGLLDAGVIFSYNPATATYTKLMDFLGSTGVYPHGSLMQANDGKLYGMTYSGGSSGVGTMFSFNPTNSAFIKLKDFDIAGGRNPRGSLIQASDGKLYGMTYSGGSFDDGISFSYAPATSVYTKLNDFNGNNGKYPVYTSYVQVSPAIAIKITNVSKSEGNSGVTTFTFNVTLSQASAQSITVNYKTKNGTATSTADYVGKTGTLTFAPGIKKQTISIAVNGDTQVETDEKFKVILSNAVNATISDSIGMGTIQNDDAAALVGSLKTDAGNRQLLIVASPNPATNLLNVQLNGYTGKTTLQLIDVNGRVLKSANVQTSNITSVHQQLDVSRIAGGTYFLVVMDETGNRHSQKIVVTH